MGSALAGSLPAFSVNPFSWLGDAASSALADVWKAAMIALWSAGLWILQLAFRVIDAFTTPDLSGRGPLAAVLPTTLWVGASVAVLMMFVQLAAALARRDGRSLARVGVGVIQFGAVWVVYLAVAAGLVAAASGLARGILVSMLHVDTMSGYDLTASWPRQVTDTTVATVLGVLSLLLVIPAAFAYVLIMLVRAAALVILVAAAPISAAGLVSDATKSWFWKSLRWYISCLLISPTAALVLGIGVRLSAGVVAGAGDKTAAAAGTAVIGAIVIAVGACCPLVLFRLLAFVEPGTASGAALRQSWSDAGGMTGLVGGGAGRASTGSSAASQSSRDGRSGGEAGAESVTQSRLAGLLGPVGAAVQAASSVAARAVDIGSDILGQAGVGAPGYSMTPTDERSTRRPAGASSGGTSSGGTSAPGAEVTGGGATPTPPAPPVVPPAPTAARPGSGGPGTGGPPGAPGPGGAQPAAVAPV